jgi:AraC family transcriptional regulator of adaptative response / DNA-3-methyladenine glycosylase II
VTTYAAVVTTGIYCRPGCSATPRAENVRTFELAASAEAAGFRACLRCRPYRLAGPVTSHAPELVCRAVRLIIDGTLDDGGTEVVLASRLGLSARHLRRVFREHLGVTPDQLARSRRAHFARRLLDDTDLTVADIAFGSGFGSLRQFNRDMREVFQATPRELRERRRRADRLVTDGGLTMRLPFAPPYDWDAVLAFLAERAVPGVESVHGDIYRRTISLDGGPGVLEVRPGGDDHLLLDAHLPYWEGLIHVVERVGHMVAIDVDLQPAVTHLAADPVLGAFVAARPGVRPPGTWGAFEVAVHAVLAQDCGLDAARERVGALVRRFGQPVAGLADGLTHLFPSAAVLAGTETAPDAVRALAGEVAGGQVRLDGGAELGELLASLTAIPGLGADAAQQIALRLGYRDAFPATALGAAPSEVGAEPQTVQAWRPWRAVAATHLLTGAMAPAKR